MSKKILIISTIECNTVKNTIFDSLNVREDRIKLEACYDKLDLLTSAKTAVGTSFNEYISNTESFETILNEIFSVDSYTPFIEEFAKQEFVNEKVFVPFSHLLEKPTQFDLIVAYAVPESLFDVDHFQEHEGVEEKNTKKLMNDHNTILRDNADKFDIFINEKSLDEALQILANA